MLSAQDLMKDGAQHLDEAIIQSINATKDLGKMTRTSLGPNGMNKMIVNHLDKLFVTSDAATIMRELEVQHPAAKLVVLASQMQEQEIGDGTNFVLVFCAELLGNAEALVQKGLHPSEVISGFMLAQQKAQEFLKELTVYTLEQVRNLTEVTKCLRSVISAKQYGYEDMLAPLIATACIQVVPKNAKNFNVDNVRTAKILGGGVLDTQVLRGHVLVREPEGVIKHVKNAKIAVFAGGIDMTSTETKSVVEIKNADQLINYNRSEEAAMEKAIKEIADAGINVVVSGGAVGEMALHFLERFKVMVVKCPSKFELRRVCKSIGATPLVRLGAPTPEETGSSDIVTLEEIGSTKVTIFRQEKEEKAGISTIVVRASTQNILDDIERAIDDGVSAYKAMVQDSRFLPGAGAVEIELAKRIQAYGDSTPGLVQYSIKKFGEAFEVIPRTLAENAGLKATDILSGLYAAHQKGNPTHGIDIEEGKIGDALALGILDQTGSKSSAIRLATDAAITVLRIDQIIMAKQAGGPKIPKQGPMDSDD